MPARQVEGDETAAHRALDAVAAAVGDDPAVVDDDDPVGVLVGLLQIVRGEQDGVAARGVGAHRRPERAPGLHVQGRGRLVEDDQLRVAGQRHGEADALGLPAGEPVDAAVREFGERGCPTRG